MNGAASTGTDPALSPALIFQWGRRTRLHWRLALMIFLSLLAHAASFYIFQVAYTPTGSLLPPPARVILVPLDQPEHAQLARWLALLDPTLVTQSPAAAPDTTLDSLNFGYVPSYDAVPADFKLLEPVASSEAIASPPRSLPPGPVVASGTPAGKPAPAADARGGPPPVPSRLVLSGNILALAAQPLPPVHYPGGVGRKTVEPTAFLVGVRPEGGASFLFPVRQAPADSTSPNADETDEFARDYLARLPFLPSAGGGADIVWGQATFYWGNDSPAGDK